MQISTGMSFFCVCAFTQTDSSATIWDNLLSKGDHVSGVNYAFAKAPPPSPCPYNPTFNYYDNGWTNVSGTYTYNTSFHLLSVIVDKDNSEVSFYVDGSLKNTTADDCDYIATSTFMATIGTSDTFAPYLKGDIGSMLLYDKILTTTEREAVEEYLTTKYDL
jgi:hypothetical protein